MELNEKLTPYKSQIENESNSEMLFEMAGLVPEKTGIHTKIWIHHKTGKEKHGARIKVRDKDKNLFPLTIAHDPKWIEGEPNLSARDKQEAVAWVKLNYTQLMHFWLHGDDINLETFLPKLKKL